MVREYKTINDAARLWVSEFNAFPERMIELLMDAEPEDWSEVTAPTVGDRAYILNLPEEAGTKERRGTISEYDEESELYRIKLDDGTTVSVEEVDFEAEYDSWLPMWGTMWQFSDNTDEWWLEERGGIRAMSQCGFRIYESGEFGYFFGIDGAGYSFYEAHWEPLYKARGLRWHDEEAEDDCRKEA